MAKPLKPSSGAQRLVARAGEGTLLSAKVASTVDATGVPVQWVEANLNEAPVPDRKYTADFGDAFIRDEEFALLFGQSKVFTTTPELRSLIVVTMSPIFMGHVIKSLDNLDGSSLVQLAAEHGVGELRTATNEPSQTIEFRASHIAIAIVNDEVCMDFFRVSPFALRAASQTSKLAIEAVVRIDIRLKLFLALEKKWRHLLQVHGKSETNSSGPSS